jgi:plasmid stability protein
MANVLIRNLEDRTVDKLKQRAARNDRSLQAELQAILERAASVDVVEGSALAARIRHKLSDRKHSDSAALVASDRKR